MQVRAFERYIPLSLPNEVGRIIGFAPFLLYLLLLPFLLRLFLSTKILSERVLSNHLTNCSEIWGYGRYGCEVVQKGFKIQNVGL